ncbi:hypothetical protein EV175_004434 [Coemansia sp. RSA 1933]|nr:hypothetical protein EV175_004434 [Coemansia sp. RSA 1933]
MIDREIARSRSLPTSTSTSTSTQPLFLLRLQPFAEIAKQRYWVFGSKSRHLYLESTSQRTKGKFELLAQTPSDFARVADHLRTQRTQAHKALANRLLEEIVPFLEKQARKRARAEKALQRQAAAIANVHVYDTRTRKRQRINYNVDDSLASVDF